MASPAEVMSLPLTPQTWPSEERPEYYSHGLRQRYNLDGSKSPAAQQQHMKPLQAYADIQYDLDEEQYKYRTKTILAKGGLESKVPLGWPQQVGGDMAWKTSDLVDESEYIYQLTKADHAEILSALAFFKEQGIDGDKVGREMFPLPNLAPRLDKASQDIYEGRGISVIRGLIPEDFSKEDFAIVYLGISSYIAERRGKQNQSGSMLIHVMEHDKVSEKVKNSDRPFHTDLVCDCLGLVTLECSAEGGRSILASVWTVYNEIAATRPDVIHTLSTPNWPMDTQGRSPPFYRRALLYLSPSSQKPILNASRRLLTGRMPNFPRTPGIPGLNERQAEALDMLHFVAEKHAIRPSMQKGDLRFFNNMALLHRREAFETRSPRHLVRMWLHNPQRCWELPPALQLAWARVFDDDDRDESWDIEPPRKDGVLLRHAHSCD